MLFNRTIANWDDWARVYQSIPAFENVVQEILVREQLPICKIEHLTPGTNAVFKVGDIVVKIYAPAESGMDQTVDRHTEIFVTRFVSTLGVPVPTILAEGVIYDKYAFAYIVMPYIAGDELDVALQKADASTQYKLGRQLRNVTGKLHVPCEPFNDIDVIHTPNRSDRWQSYPHLFNVQRREYIDRHNYGDYVLVHGDLCGGNVLVTDTLMPIDYADAVLAPICYEHSLVFFEYQAYPHFLKGYFAEAEPLELAQDVFNGILIHDFGGDIVRHAFGSIHNFKNLDVLRREIGLRAERLLMPLWE